MAEVVFFIAAIGAIAGAGGTVALRNPFYSVLALVGHLLSLAALFLLLRAEFVAAAQVVVYAGAVMVLYVFVSAYIGRVDHSVGPNPGPGLKGLSFAFAGALLIEFFVAILGTGLEAIDTEGTGWFPGFGSPAEIGKLLLTDYLLAFEVASFLLLVAAVGAVILARRREGLEPVGTLSVSDLFARPEDAGTIEGHEPGSILEAGGSPKR
jgi:NADH:ubiquinone oxidoreductase subunit 6 (subunit J)